MAEIVGTFGNFALIAGDRPIFDMNLEASVAFFRELTVKKSDITLNQLGVYSFLNVGRYGKALMNRLSVPRHLLQSRKNCLTWTPKGIMYLTPNEVNTFPIELMAEQCTDFMLGDCLEAILGPQNGKRDFGSTAEAQALFGQALANIFLGLGNSFYDLVHYGGDPLITSSDDGDWWNTGTTTNKQWDDFKDQQLNTGVTGLIPLIEKAKADGLTNFNVDIPAGDVSGPEYVGTDVRGLLDSCIAAAPTEFGIIVKRRQQIQSAFLCTRGIYDAYYNFLIDNYTSIPISFQMLVEGEPVPGVLMYKGIPLVCVDEWTLMDDLLGVNTHRVVLTALGNMAIAHDMQPLDQFNGMGMRIERSPLLRDKGRTYMNMTFRVGCAIPDVKFMVNASRILTP